MKKISLILSSLALLLLFLSSSTDAHDITAILANHTEFSLFNRFLTLTKVADEVNKRGPITVCVFNDTAMVTFSRKYPDDASLKAVLSFHVILDYYDNKRFLNFTAPIEHATLFQASGPSGDQGIVRIAKLNTSEIGFGPKDNGSLIEAVFVKSIFEVSYDISVIQISDALWPLGDFVPPPPPPGNSSAPVPAPAPAPTPKPSKSPPVSSPPAPPSDDSPAVPAPSPDEKPSDQEENGDDDDKNAGFISKSGIWIAVVLCACVGALNLV